MAQVPGKAISVRINYVNAVDEELQFDILSYQEATTPWDETMMGDEVNYMTEFDKYGRESHYQDPTRGRITNPVGIVADAAIVG